MCPTREKNNPTVCTDALLQRRMPLHAKENLIESVVAIIAFIRSEQEQLEKTQDPLLHTRTLQDVHFKLNMLLSSMLTAPLTGRMALPMPVAYTTQDVVRDSLVRQLQLES